MTKRRAKPILASAAIALSLAGCGGMGGDEQAPQTGASAGTGASASAAPSPRDPRMPLYGQMVGKDQPTPPQQQYPTTQQQRAMGQEQYSPASRRGAMMEQRGGQQQSMAAAGDMRPEVVRDVQRQLDQRGYEVGPIDGIWGPRTQQAVTAFQRDENLRASGRIDSQTLAALGMDESGQQVGETPVDRQEQETQLEQQQRLEQEQMGATPRGEADIGPREQTGELPGETGGTDLPQEPGTLPDTGSEAPGSEQPSERSGGIQGNEPAIETPKGGTPETPR